VYPLQSGIPGGPEIVLVQLLFLAVFAYTVYWTYTDAQRRSDQPAVLWAAVVFIAPLLGLLLYFLLGRR